jgi:uncharacterized damage-inducible protein DinB
MSAFSFGMFRELYRHMEWADATMWRSVLANEAAREDTKLRELLHHLHIVQQLFLAFWTGQSPLPIAQRPASDFAQLPDVKAWAQPYYAEVLRLLDAGDTLLLERPLVMPWVREFEQKTGKTFAVPSIAETMFQVVHHTTHHRAQVNARLRVIGGEPQLVDYIGWVWFGKPAAEWQ